MLFARLFFGGDDSDWTADERAAIRAILGIPSSGTTPETPVSGVLAAIKTKTDLIGTATAFVSSPTQQADKIVGPLIIGDDYLHADNRAITFNVTTAFDPATCFLGFENEKGVALLLEGSKVSYTDGVAVIRFEITKTQSANLRPGPYDYSIEIRGASANEVTVIHSKTNGARVTWIRKYT